MITIQISNDLLKIEKTLNVSKTNYIIFHPYITIP